MPRSPSTPATVASGGDPLGRLALALAFALLAALAVRQVGSLDAGFQLRAGEYVLEHNAVPDHDPFTYTIGDHAYLDTSWGYQVLLALVHRAGGVAGLTLFHAAMVLATFALVLATMRLDKVGSGAAAALLVLGTLASELRFQVRPELLSYLLLAAVAYLLQRQAAGRRSPLWLLPPLFLVWVNAHGLFVVGWALVAAFVIGGVVRERRLDRRLAGWSLAAIAVGPFNPYGWRALVFPLTLATRLDEDNVFGRTIGEFTSPFKLPTSEQLPFQPWPAFLAFYALVALALVALLPLVRRRRWEAIAIVPPFLWLSSTAVRNIPLFAVACLPGIAWALGSRERKPGATRFARRRAAAKLALALFTAVLCARVVHDAYYLDTRREDRFGLGWNRTALPVDAVAFANRAGLTGRVLNQLGFGGYLMWARPEAVFIDGRLEVVGERFYEQYRRILDSQRELEAAVAHYGIEWIVFPYKTGRRLLGRLSRDPHWRLAYVDHLATIFVRVGTAAENALDATAAAALAPPAAWRIETLAGLGGGPRHAGLRRWWAGVVRPERFPSSSFGLGLFHYLRGDPARAAAFFAQSIAESDGAYYESYIDLGSALFRLERYEDARACYRVALGERPDNDLALRRLAEIDERLGR